jgi:hypothetical protein
MEMGRSVEEVEAVTSFYYKTLRSKLSSLESTMVHVHNLGNFYVKEKALDKSIDITGKFLARLNPADFTEYGMRKQMKVNHDLMKALKEKLNDERSRRRDVINKRFNNEPKEKRDSDMEE